MSKQTLLNAKDLEKNISRITDEIVLDNKDTENLVVIGIKTRGEYLGKRISSVSTSNRYEGSMVPQWRDTERRL